MNCTSFYFPLNCGATIAVLPFASAAIVYLTLTELKSAEASLTAFDDSDLITIGMITPSVQYPLSGTQCG